MCYLRSYVISQDDYQVVNTRKWRNSRLTTNCALFSLFGDIYANLGPICWTELSEVFSWVNDKVKYSENSPFYTKQVVSSLSCSFRARLFLRDLHGPDVQAGGLSELLPSCIDVKRIVDCRYDVDDDDDTIKNGVFCIRQSQPQMTSRHVLMSSKSVDLKRFTAHSMPAKSFLTFFLLSLCPIDSCYLLFSRLFYIPLSELLFCGCPKSNSKTISLIAFHKSLV